jgi:hypothetical protein
VSTIDDSMVGLILIVFSLLVCGLILLGQRPQARQVPVGRGGEPRERLEKDARR